MGADQSPTTRLRFWLDEGARADAALEHFTLNHPRFEAAFQSWDLEQQSVFKKLILLVHDAGFDWYHIKQHPYELRFGRKEKGNVLAYPSLAAIRKTPPVLSIFGEKSDGKGLGFPKTFR
jgi:hypothetical protein